MRLRHTPRPNRLFALSLAFLFASLALGSTGTAQAHKKSAAKNASRRQTPPPPPKLTLDEMIEIAAGESGISTHLLREVVRQESSGRWWVVSPAGASGLAQLMPGTAKRFGVQNRFDPMQNLRGGARYLRWLLDYFGGDVKLTLAAYNAGEGAVMKYGRRIPPYRETQDYVARIYPRFVNSATRGRSSSLPVVLTTQTSPRRAAARSGGSKEEAEPTTATAVEGESNAQARSTGASVYFWQPARTVAPGVLPK